MALNTAALKSAIKAAFQANLPAPTATQLSELDTMCTSIANAMQAFVQSATITYTTGLANGSGPVTGVFGNIIT